MARRNRNTERSASATKNVKPRIRIKELRTVRVGDLVPNPENWRTHPDEQRRAFNAAVERVGIADAPKVWESPDGLMILDGHLRAEELDDDAEIPVQVLDVDEDEARFLLATYDPMAMLAQADKEATAALLAQIDAGDDIEALLAQMRDLAQIPVITEGRTDPDDVPEVPETPVTQPGDVWLLGAYYQCDGCGKTYDYETGSEMGECPCG